LQGSAYHFNITEKDEMIHLKKKFTKPSDYNLGTYSNIVADGSGLTIIKTTEQQSQYGVWQYNFPIVQYINFAGINISWDSASTEYSPSLTSSYIKVSASYDAGNTWHQVKNNNTVPYFLSSASSASSAQLLVKVEINSFNSSKPIQPRIDNLNVTIYKNLNVPADSGGFILSPTLNSTYIVRQNSESILSREKNFGINFINQNDDTSNPGTAVISSSNNTLYQTIEFWFKYKSSNDLNFAAVLDTNIINDTDLYINPSTNLLISNLGQNATLYVNGIKHTNGTCTIIAGEIYHIVVAYQQPSSNNIYINGSHDGLKTPPKAMYGFITLFPQKLSDKEIQNRYLAYLTTTSKIVYDSTTSLGSVLEYFGNDSTSINGGLAVIANERKY
jgi:hypothetical protein